MNKTKGTTEEAMQDFIVIGYSVPVITMLKSVIRAKTYKEAKNKFVEIHGRLLRKDQEIHVQGRVIKNIEI